MVLAKPPPLPRSLLLGWMQSAQNAVDAAAVSEPISGISPKGAIAVTRGFETQPSEGTAAFQSALNVLKGGQWLGNNVPTTTRSHPAFLSSGLAARLTV